METFNNLEVDGYNLDLYEINKEGTIVIEKAVDKFTLEFEDVIIDLNREYIVEKLDIVQGDNSIALEDDDQIEYFKKLIKEI